MKEVVYAYNTSVQDSSQHTPFEVMFGRVARLPIDMILAVQTDPDEKADNYQCNEHPSYSGREAEKRRLEEDVRENIEQAQEKQKLSLTESMVQALTSQLE